MDRLADMVKPKAAFHNFPNAPTNQERDVTIPAGATCCSDTIIMLTPTFSTNEEIELSHRTKYTLSAQNLQNSKHCHKVFTAISITHFMILVGK
jgi:hypothetical protein